MALLIRILQLIASLTLLVVIHEFGHFIFARLFKIRVDKFYIFFNPGFSLFKFKPKNSDTEYGIGWLPLGGYTKIAGMIDESMDTEQMAKPAQPWEFRSHPAWHRLLVMAGGVMFNFILAMLIYVGISYAFGEKYLPMENVKAGLEYSETAKRAGFTDGDLPISADGAKILTLDEENVRKIINANIVTVKQENGKEKQITMPFDFMQQLLQDKQGFASYRFPFIVDSVMAGSPAEKSKLQPNDEVIAIDGRRMYATDIFITTGNNPGKTLNYTIVRGKDTLNVPIKITAQGDEGKIGVYVRPIINIYGIESVHYSLLQSVPAGIHRGWKKVSSYVSDLKYIFTKEGAQSVGGFGTIAKLYPEFWSSEIFWEMTAFLSLILAVMNLLPIPGLDGGHIMFLFYEIIARRKPNQDVLIKAQMIGMALLLFLFLYANMNDVLRSFF